MILPEEGRQSATGSQKKNQLDHHASSRVIGIEPNVFGGKVACPEADAFCTRLETQPKIDFALGS
jgi:hypothetical protein